MIIAKIVRMRRACAELRSRFGFLRINAFNFVCIFIINGDFSMYLVNICDSANILNKNGAY